MLVKRYTTDQDILKASTSGQGTLMGVVFPCMANILGVLLFLRLPWIVGKAGTLNAFLLVLLCCICTFVTTLSLSAVATNGMIKGGGAYFLISRSLGPSLGAGVGLCFYMANSIGAAMYFMGTVEAWEIAQPDMQLMTAGDLNNIRFTGFIILAVALVMVGGGIKYVARLGTFFLFLVLLVILCMYLGCLIGPTNGGTYELGVTDSTGNTTMMEMTWGGLSAEYLSQNFKTGYDLPQKAFPSDTTQYTFIGLMALWFPAVTGIMAGSNRSADLDDPAGSIPKGTLFAQGLTSLIYLSFVLLYGAVAPRSTLLDDKFFASSSAWPFKEVVLYGVMASTIGAGLTSLTSGTRLLSAIASDNTLPILHIFAVPMGREPRLALLASGVLCACAIAIGELNAVAPVLTMFFLMCYTCVNMSCTILEAVHDPNWRPRFRYHHWSISLFGAILCVWMMFAISAVIALIAIIFCSVIFAYAAYNSHEVKWGDGFQGMKFQLARNILTNMDLRMHTKNWRPQLLVITGASITENTVDEFGRAHSGKDEVLSIHDPELLNIASQMNGGRGLTLLGGVCSSKGKDIFSDGGMFLCTQHRQKVLDGQDAFQRLLGEYHIEGFGRVVYTEDYSEGLMGLVQLSGLGAFQPNTIVAAWPREWNAKGNTGQEARAHFIRLVQVAVVFQKVFLCCKGSNWPSLTVRLNGVIDIWWIVGDGGILLLLPFLLAKHRVWQSCRTRLFVLADRIGDDPEMMRMECEKYVRDFRLNVEVCVKLLDDGPITVDDLEESQSVDGFPDLEVNKEKHAAVPPVRSAEAVPQPKPCRSKSAETPVRPPLSAAAHILRDTSNASIASVGMQSQESTSVRSMLWANGGKPPGTFSRQASPAGGLKRSSSPHSTTSPQSIVPDFPTFASRPAGYAARPSQLGKRQISEDYAAPKVHFSPAELLLMNAHSDPGPWRGAFQRQITPEERQQVNAQVFMSSAEQLASVQPCSKAELLIARTLNAAIVAESKESDLVVTNLPDMPPSESAFGYFQLVDEITKNLQRCILVRGTTTEVITAFT